MRTTGGVCAIGAGIRDEQGHLAHRLLTDESTIAGTFADQRQGLLMAHDNDSTARQFYDAWNARDFDRVAGFLAPDGEIVLVGSGSRFAGPDGAKQWSEGWAGGFPDGEVTINRTLSAGDQVVIQFTGRGTHTGDFVTPGGTLPPTGRPAVLEFCDVMDMRGGKIVSLHSYFDTAALLAQLGLMPTPAAPGK